VWQYEGGRAHLPADLHRPTARWHVPSCTIARRRSRRPICSSTARFRCSRTTRSNCAEMTDRSIEFGAIPSGTSTNSTNRSTSRRPSWTCGSTNVMRRGVIKDAGALKRPDANLPGCNAHGEGEDDRSLTPSNIKPDRSTSISCQIELHLIHFSCCRLPPAPPRQRHEPGRLLPRQCQTSFARRFCQANKCCGANRASGRPPTPTRRVRKIAQRSAPSPPPPPPPAPDARPHFDQTARG
jgi:hypothetical protein